MTTNEQHTTDLSEGDRVCVDGEYEATVEYTNETHVGVMTSVGPVASSGFREVKRENVKLVDDDSSDRIEN